MMPAGIGIVRPQLSAVRGRAHFFSLSGPVATLFRVAPESGRRREARDMETHWIVTLLGQLAGLLTG